MTGADDGSGEDRLIGRYFRPIATDPRALGLVDDVALMPVEPGTELVLKTDAIVGGVHFFADDPPDAIARKALRVNLSDLAAKGAVPSGCLMTLALPDGITDAWLAPFARGLAQDCGDFACPLLGGDMVRTPGPVMVSIAVVGTVPAGRLVPRTGAGIGDHVVVTGTIGDAALGLRLRMQAGAAERLGLSAPMVAHLLDRYRLPQPRNVLAEALRAHASAAMDVSDGLAGDLAKLCRASGVGARVEVERMPLSPAARAALDAEPALIEPVLTGGDDYEVVCAIPPARLDAFVAAAAETGVPVTAIGRIEKGVAPPAFIQSGRPLAFVRPSFSHF